MKKYVLPIGAEIWRRRKNDRSWEIFTTTKEAYYESDDLVVSEYKDIQWVSVSINDPSYDSLQFKFVRLLDLEFSKKKKSVWPNPRAFK